MLNSHRLTVESLEDRCLLAAFGIPWPDARHLTLSVAPDGTAIAGKPSELAQSLSSIASPEVWQRELLRAFQTWAVNANINIGLVRDQGLPFGTGGLLQSDPRFGDIRIGGSKLTGELIGQASPFDWSGTTWSGDILLNSSYFSSRVLSLQDLRTVALHEVGHALGLDHDDIPGSVMQDHYLGPIDSLLPENIAALQALYGKRQPDAFEGDYGTGWDYWAKDLTAYGQSGRTTLEADLTSLSDVDIYSVRTSSENHGIVRISVQTSGFSLLVPKASLYDSWGRLVAQTIGSSPGNADLTFDLSGLKPSTYFLRVEPGSQDVFGIGGYKLVLDPANPKDVTSIDPDRYVRDRFTSAINLLASVDTDARFAYTARAELSYAGDTDLYKVKSDKETVPGAPTVLKASVWSTDSKGLQPRLTIYDSQRVPVPFQVLGNENGSFTLEIANPVPNSFYYVEVGALRPAWSRNVGAYALAVDFLNTAPLTLNTFATGTLQQGAAQDFRTLEVQKTQLFHFVFSGTGDTALDAGTRMTIFDAKGRAVFSLVALANELATTGVVLLEAGTYQVRFTGATRTGSGLTALSYLLRGRPLSDQEGISLLDPLANPVDPSGGGSTTTYLWWQDPYYYYSALVVSDPGRDVWLQY